MGELLAEILRLERLPPAPETKERWVAANLAWGARESKRHVDEDLFVVEVTQLGGTVLRQGPRQADEVIALVRYYMMFGVREIRVECPAPPVLRVLRDDGDDALGG